MCTRLQEPWATCSLSLPPECKREPGRRHRPLLAAPPLDQVIASLAGLEVAESNGQ